MTTAIFHCGSFSVLEQKLKEKETKEDVVFDCV